MNNCSLTQLSTYLPEKEIRDRPITKVYGGFGERTK